MSVPSPTVPQADEVAARRNKKRRRHLVRRIIIWTIVLVVLAAAGYVGIFMLREQYTTTYQAYAATTGSISNSLSFSGTLQAVNSRTYTASSAGTVRMLYVSLGDNVKKGDKLMRLSSGQTVEADFDGRINQLPLAEGDTAAQGDTLLQLVDFDHMKVSVRVDEYNISDVHAGDACRVITTATENTFASAIDNINYVSSSSGSVAYYTATAYVDITGAQVYPGMQVTVSIAKEEATDVVILKEDAVSFDETNRAFVYMRNDDGSLEQVYISTGVSNGNYVEITAGLTSGDEVYKEQTKTASTSIASMFSSLFSTQRYTGGSNNNRRNNNSSSGGSNRPGSNSFGGGNMPGGSNFGGGR